MGSFPSLEGAVIKNVVDSDNVSVAKRKHKLLSRLRGVKAREGMPAQKQGRWYDARKGTASGKESAMAKASEGVGASKEREGEETAKGLEEEDIVEESEEGETTKESAEAATLIGLGDSDVRGGAS